MPGVEVHAQLLDGILSNAILTRPNYAIGAELAAAIATGLAIILLVRRRAFGLPRRRGTRGDHRGRIVLALSARGPADRCHLSADMRASRCSWRWCSSTISGRKTAAADPLGLSANICRPQFVEELARNPDKLKLGGETKEVSILFSATYAISPAIAEIVQVEPAGADAAHQQPAHAAVRGGRAEQAGTIDKYIGDSIMAFWNAPLDDAEHAQACLHGGARRWCARCDELNASMPGGGTAKAARRRSMLEGRRRHKHRPMRRRQYGLGCPLRLHGARRQREPRVAPRRSDQDLWRTRSSSGRGPTSSFETNSRRCRSTLSRSRARESPSRSLPCSATRTCSCVRSSSR